jgi:hypothetical protein
LNARADRYRYVLVLYLERPTRNSGLPHALIGALLIQRLEGSRPHLRLCTLNRSDRVRRFREDAEIGMVCQSAGRMERRRTVMKQPSGAAAVAERASADG